MKFGVCCSPSRSREMAELGFDFVEWSIAGNLAAADDSAIAELTALAQSLPVTPEVWNILLPGDLKIVGPDVDTAQLGEYLERVLPIVRNLGGEVVVFGSGRARTIPDGFDRATAVDQFRTAALAVAEAAQSSNLMITLEPLRKEESNIVNTVQEGLMLVEALAHPALELLADMYHMAENGEDFASIAGSGNHLRHVHIAARGSRLIPLDGGDVEELTAFLHQVKGTGYDARMSFETRAEAAEDFLHGLQVLKKSWMSA